MAELTAELTAEEKYDIITAGLAEVIGKTELKNKLEKGKTLKVYWGTSPTGKPHIGYFIPLIKLAQIIKAGCEVTILIADLHAYLDSMKTTWELLDLRSKYYTELIQQILLQMNVDLTKVKFVKGSDFQLSKDYTIDVYKFMSKITIDSAIKGGAEVVKQSNNPMLSGVTYPLLQSLDEVYLGADCELGGIDQRKIFMLSRDHMHKLNYTPVVHLMNKMMPSIVSTNTEDETDKEITKQEIDSIISKIEKLKTKNLTHENFLNIVSKITTEVVDKQKKKIEKMGSSEASGKIEFTEEPKEIVKKIKKIFAEFKNTNNRLFVLLERIIFPVNALRNIDSFVINEVRFICIDDIKKQYSEDIVTPQDLKLSIANWFIDFLTPVRNYFQTEEMKKLVFDAYST